MAISSAQLWQRISQWNLASASECRRWAAEVAQELGASVINDPQKILGHLVKSNRLTSLQATTLLEAHPRPIVFKGYRALEWSTEPWLSGWMDGVDAQGKPIQIFSLDPQFFQSNAIWSIQPPSLSLAKAHARVQGPFLHPIQDLVVQPPAAALIIPQLRLTPIRDSLFARPMSPTESSQRILQLAHGLEHLHEAGLSHGRLSPSAIVSDELGNIVLLRDPFFAGSPGQGKRPSIFRSIAENDSLDLHYAAPEFLVPGQLPTPASDLYALGCLWYEFLTGNPPFAAVAHQHLLAAHASQPIEMSRVASLPPEALACLMHLCAKNPKSRFANATDLIQALTRAVPALAAALKPAVATPTKVERAIEVERPASTSTSASASESKTKDPKTASRKTASSTSSSKVSVPPAAVNAAATTPAATTPVAATPVAATPVAATPVAATPVAATPVATTPPVPRKPTTKESKAPPLTPPAPVQQSPLPNRSLSSTPATAATSVAPAPAAKPVKDPDTTGTAASQKPNSKSAAKPKAKKKSKKKKGQRPAWVMPVLGGISFVGLLGLVLVLSSGGGKKKKGSAGDNTSTLASQGTNGNAQAGPTEVPAAPPPDPVAEQFIVQADDGKMLWAPPHPMEPYSLDLLPPGAQAFLFFRPTPWSISETGRSLLALFEEPLKKPWELLKNGSGMDVNDIEEVAIGFYSGATEPQIAVRIKPKSSRPRAEFERLWGTSSEVMVGDAKLYRGADRLYFLKPKNVSEPNEIASFSYGPQDLMKEVAELQGSAGPLRRQMEVLRLATDARSDLTILLAPGFLFSPEMKGWIDLQPRYQAPLQKLLGKETQGLLFTTSLEPQWYSELRLMATNEQDAGRLLQSFSSQVGSMANSVEQEMVANPAHPYWRAISVRMPQMLRSLQKRQRTSIEGGQVVSNVYLPSFAAPNLAFATWMYGQDMGDGEVAVVSSGQPPSKTQSMSIDEILNRPVDVVFDQQSLETAMNSILEEINNGLPEGADRIRMEIDGGAFEKDGITRNKEVRNFNFKKQPGRSVLMDLIKKANPESVAELSNPAQKVVWVAMDDPKNPGKKLIQITTRKGVESAKLSLPKEFIAP